MPTYQFRNKETGEVSEQFMRMADKDQFLQDNPNLEAVFLEAPPLGDPVRLGIRKVDSGFKEVLQKIKRANPGSTLDV